MALSPVVPPAIAVAGFLVLIIGSMGYMGVFPMATVPCYILMIVGLLAVICGMALMMYRGGSCEASPEEE